jgi:IclR family pca regulon transcriptional regulator
MGRVLLAGLEADARTRFLKRVKLRQYTDRTITDRHALAAELDKVASQGFAIVDQELEPGLRSCAVPIARPDGVVIAALNVGVHASRADVASLTRDVLPILRRAAADIRAALDTPQRTRS